MNPPPGARAEDGEDRDSSYPNKRVRMSPSVATTNTASGTAEASPANSTSTYLGASPSSTHPDSLLPTPGNERTQSDTLNDTFTHSEHPSHTGATIHTGSGLEGVENKLAPKTGSSSFRNVSACNRCRLRKNRCDQRLPSCASCGKAGVRCTGYDPITKREIPRRYVQFQSWVGWL